MPRRNEFFGWVTAGLLTLLLGLALALSGCGSTIVTVTLIGCGTNLDLKPSGLPIGVKASVNCPPAIMSAPEGQHGE